MAADSIKFNFDTHLVATKTNLFMKSFLLILTNLLFTSVLFATVRTVSNFPANVAQFNDIQSAINASANGDTVYVHGSPNAYSGFTINNIRVIIIGPGWSPNKQLPFNAVVGTCNMTGTGSSGSEIHGLDFTGTFNIATGGGIDNIRFIRNRFRCGQAVVFQCCSNGTYSGYLFEGNWFENSMIRTDQPTMTFNNFIVQNNLFFENGSCIGGSLSGFTNASNFLIDHNLFYGNGSSPRDVFASNCRFLVITNNIFIRRNASSQNSFSTFNNNITLNTGSDAPWTVNSNSDGGGNVAGTSPQMVDQAGVDGGTDDPLQNFTIAAGPADNSGSDGKDMGLLYDATGSLNWNNSRASRIPFIFSMNITTPTVAPGGNVSVTVESRRSN